MIELTKQQRHEIYNEALSLLLTERISYNFTTGICEHLYFSAHSLGYLLCPDFTAELLSEFYSFKPENSSIWWWSIHDFDSRIEVLEKCIELTKPNLTETL